MEIEQAEWIRFLRMYKEGCYTDQRFGQAFYNHFKLHKCNIDQNIDSQLYNTKNKQKAMHIISQTFIFK